MISDQDRKVLTDIVAREDAWMADRGVSWSVSRDYGELRRFGYEISGFLNATFDPDKRKPGPSDLWLRCTDHNGRTIGSVAIALFRDCRLAELVNNCHLWHDNPPTGWQDRMRIDFDNLVAEGDVVHAGATMLHRDWRNNSVGDATGRFSNHMIRLARARWLSEYDADWWTGFFRSAMFRNRIALYAHGINPDDCVKFMQGYIPVMGFSDQVYAMQVPVRKMVSALRDQSVIGRRHSRKNKPE